jgi:hypothetical protein
MATTTVRDNKDSNAKLDYLFTWQDWLGSAIISSASVSDASGDLIITAPTVASTNVQVVISGGTEGKTYDVVNRVLTDTGLIEDKVLQLTITDMPSTSHTITVETGSGVAGANSYASVADGNSYHASHLYATTWHQANDATKEKALIWATRLIDDYIVFDGSKADSDNPLKWPRTGATDNEGWVIDNNVIPTSLKNATAEWARSMIAEDRTAFSETDDRGFSRIKAGSLELDIDGNDRKGVVPPMVTRMIRHLASNAMGGAGYRKVLRV